MYFIQKYNLIRKRYIEKKASIRWTFLLAPDRQFAFINFIFHLNSEFPFVMWLCYKWPATSIEWIWKKKRFLSFARRGGRIFLARGFKLATNAIESLKVLSELAGWYCVCLCIYKWHVGDVFAAIRVWIGANLTRKLPLFMLMFTK